METGRLLYLPNTSVKVLIRCNIISENQDGYVKNNFLADRSDQIFPYHKHRWTVFYDALYLFSTLFQNLYLKSRTRCFQNYKSF